MSEKRRDKKGRILRNGECQRDNGLYQFDYVDIFGKAKCVYSWKLEETDPLPKGKRKCISLREKEKEILKDIDDGLIHMVVILRCMNMLFKEEECEKIQEQVTILY